MVRSLRFVPAVLLAIVAAGCGNSTPTSTNVSVPVQVTESLFGTIPVNGASTGTFTENKAGTVTVTVAALSPDDSVKVGLWLGTWNGTSCAMGLAKEDAALSSVIVGSASGPGTLCVRVYDNGGLATPTDYEVRVDHF